MSSLFPYENGGEICLPSATHFLLDLHTRVHSVLSTLLCLIRRTFFLTKKKRALFGEECVF